MKWWLQRALSDPAVVDYLRRETERNARQLRESAEAMAEFSRAAARLQARIDLDRGVTDGRYGILSEGSPLAHYS